MSGKEMSKRIGLAIQQHHDRKYQEAIKSECNKCSTNIKLPCNTCKEAGKAISSR